MTIIKCPNCGASVKNNTGSCSYCGSNLSIETNSTIVTNVKPDTLATAIDGCFPLMKTGTGFVLVFLILFFCVWCGGTITGGIEMLKSIATPMAIVPFGMTLFGIVFCFIAFYSVLKQKKQESLTAKYLSLTKAHKFDEAFRLGQQIKNASIAQALIAFYHKQDYDTAKELLLQTNSKTSYAGVSTLVANMYKYFGFDIPNSK